MIDMSRLTQPRNHTTLFPPRGTKSPPPPPPTTKKKVYGRAIPPEHLLLEQGSGFSSGYSVSPPRICAPLYQALNAYYTRNGISRQVGWHGMILHDCDGHKENSFHFLSFSIHSLTHSLTHSQCMFAKFCSGDDDELVMTWTARRRRWWRGSPSTPTAPASTKLPDKRWILGSLNGRIRPREGARQVPRD